MQCELASDQIFEILILMRADKISLEDAWESIIGRKPTHQEALAVDVKILKMREGWVMINQNIRRLPVRRPQNAQELWDIMQRAQEATKNSTIRFGPGIPPQ